MYTYEIFFILVIVRPTAIDEHLEKKLVFRRKTLDDNDDDDDDVERSKKRWQPTKDSRAKEKMKSSLYLPFLYSLLFSWVIYKV